MMKKVNAMVVVLVLAGLMVAACTTEQSVNMDAILKQPKTFVGSDTCKQCHLEHYDSWKMTLHSP